MPLPLFHCLISYFFFFNIKRTHRAWCVIWSVCLFFSILSNQNENQAQATKRIFFSAFSHSISLSPNSFPFDLLIGCSGGKFFWRVCSRLFYMKWESVKKKIPGSFHHISESRSNCVCVYVQPNFFFNFFRSFLSIFLCITLLFFFWNLIVFSFFRPIFLHFFLFVCLFFFVVLI